MALTQVDQGLLSSTAQYTGFKNRIINGQMQIWQRGTSFTGITGGTYTADRFQINLGTIGSGVFKAEQVADAPAGTGFKYSLKLSPTTAMASVNAAAYIAHEQLIEGFNCADLMYGTAYAQSITLTFWVKSNVAGLCCGTVIQNAAAAGAERSYPYNFTIASADTWQLVTVVIPGDTGGAIANNNTWGLQFNFGYMAIGSNYQNGTLNAWNANPSGTAYLPSGFTYLNRASSTSNYISITGVQLEKGSTATSFDYRPYGTELALCQRYYTQLKLGCTGVFGSATSGNFSTQFPVQMRAAPTYGQTGVITADNFYSATSTQSATSTTLLSADVSGGTFRLANFSGFTAGQPSQLAPSNTNYVTVSAEL
jgi:hypothetical protein